MSSFADGGGGLFFFYIFDIFSCCEMPKMKLIVLGLNLSWASFQMVSLLKLAKVTEEGVRFLSPHDGTPM